MPVKDEIYMPVLAGAKSNYKKGITYQRDDSGENISDKNANYSELTVVYWAWKNMRNVDNIGLVHYRRFFAKKHFFAADSVLSINDIEELLKKTNVVLPRKRRYYIETNYSHYVHAHHSEPLKAVKTVLVDFYPEYVEEFDRVMSRRSAHMFNMFIMNKNFFQQYCEWLFSVLNKTEKRVKIENYSAQEVRVFGYLSELLMDVWIETNRISYTEVGYVQFGKKHTLKKLLFFLLRKFSIGKIETHF